MKKNTLIIICNVIFDFLSDKDKKIEKITIDTKTIRIELSRPNKSTTVEWDTGLGNFTISYGYGPNYEVGVSLEKYIKRKGESKKLYEKRNASIYIK